MNFAFQSYQVREPRPQEIAGLAEPFARSLLGSERLKYLGAFGQPGEVPLGAVAWRAYDMPGGALGVGFQIFVRPEVRRRGVGTNLMRQLFAVATQLNAERVDLAG